MLLALTGVATAGKDVFADQLVASQYKFVKLGFADPMYKMAEAMDPILATNAGMVSLKFILAACYGDWTEAKRIESVRVFLQRLGQSGREQLGQDIWVNRLFLRIDALPEGTNVVITNVRHENEAEAVLRHGGHLIHVKRKGVEPVNGHVSEAGLAFKYATATLHNDGTADEWKRSAVGNFERLCVSR